MKKFFLKIFLFLTTFRIFDSLHVESCDVVILGGSLSSFSAAISSAQLKVRTCLIEPTDWIGGQLTSSGVPAIDFAWHTLEQKGKKYLVYKYSRMKENLTPSFNELVSKVGNAGNCWVSINCFDPKVMLKEMHQIVNIHKEYLSVYTNSVIKSINEDDNVIKSIEVIHRIAKNSTDCNGYDIFLSDDIANYYNPYEDTRYHKKIISFSGKIFIESSEWGELLALLSKDGTYLQGLSERYDGDISILGDSTCSQVATYGFAQKLHEDHIFEPKNPYPVHHGDFYSLDGMTWDKVWTYRRLIHQEGEIFIKAGDVTLQNIQHGNDYAFSSCFKSIEDTKKERNDWKGGMNVTALKEAEYLAYGYHYYYKKKNFILEKRITMEKKFFGTCHGLVKVPYIRETRRSIGIDNFIMNVSQISGDFEKSLTGLKYHDRVAIGCYNVDIHSLYSCTYPDYVKAYYPILPFHIPYRAMTNRNYKNLLVSGKSIAQSFLTSSATRTHPVEYSIGTATGVVSAYMIMESIFDTKDVLKKINDLQELVKSFTPIDWTIKD